MEEDFYSPSLLASLLSSGMQSFPTEQPVVAVPYTDMAGTTETPTISLSPEEIARIQAGFAEQRAQYAALNDPAYLANQQAKADWLAQQNTPSSYYTPAYDPLNFSANAGSILNLFSPTPQPAFDPSNPTANMTQIFNIDTRYGTTPLAFQPGMTYTMVDSGGNTLATATTPEEMQTLVALSKTTPAFTIKPSGTPTSGYDVTSGGPITKTNSGSFGSMILPMLALAGAGFGLSALGLGAGAGGTAAGTAAGGTAAGTAAGTTAGALTGTAAGAGAGAAGTAAGLAPLVGPGWTVLAPAATGLTTTGAVLGGSTLAAALAAAANAPGATSYANQVWGDQASAPTGGEANLSYVDPVTGDIVVPSGTTSFPMDPNSILAGFLGSQFAPLTSVNIPPTAGTELPQVTEDIPEGTGPDIIAEAPKPVLDASAAIIPALTSVAIPALAGTTLPSTGPSTLEQIMKYYSLGSGLLDMLGVGQGGAASGTASPYASTLGAVPNFGRGTFQPFTGDYEKYAFGPEWNFFGNNAQTPATTANTLAATTPANTLLPALTATTATPTARMATTGVTAGLLNAPMQATKQQAAQYISNLTAGNVAKAPEVTVPGLTGAQQLYLNSLSGTSSPTASNIDYVRSLSDYQALASLANTQGVFQPLNSPLNGYKTASDLSALYGVPVTSM